MQALSKLRRLFRIRFITREQLLANRFVKPFAHRLESPLLWQMNRRAVARGIALGLFVGFLLPIGQIVLAALLALSLRANVVIAATATLVTNPLTFPPIYFAAYKLGCGILGMEPGEADAEHYLLQSLHQIGTPTIAGLLLFALISAITGYAAVHVGWRLYLSRRWRRRLHARRH
jgi:uncharacterized protein (DUF2062 family)